MLNLKVATIALTSPLHRDKGVFEAGERFGVRLPGKADLAGFKGGGSLVVNRHRQEGALVLDRSVHMGRVGVVHDADNWHSVNAEGKGDADGGEGMDEVGGSVNGVTDECGFVSEFHAWDVRLLAEESAIY